ncbi:MAG: RNA-directed DNA polymerase [Eubacteriales bacterium]|nr:RNA-directed DNA polymerase [Eubacteriales bacterium]
MTDERYSYENIYGFSNLYNAYRMAARGKRNAPDIIRFELDLAQNLWRLHEELKDRTYRPSGYYRFMIYDPKKREIQASYFRDRVLQHSLCDNILRPYFENRLIYDCAACRQGKGTHFAMRRLSEFLRKFYSQHGTNGFFLKCDVRKYFDSVDHEVLKQRLENFPDERMRDLLYMIIDSHNADTGKGLPLGNQTSQWFALYYLDPVDRLIKEQYRIKYYTRYMDDLVLIHEDKEYLKEVLAGVRDFADQKLHLEFNQKTQIFPLSQGVDYLGWHFYLTDTGKIIKKLRSSNKQRFKRRLKAFARKYAQEEMTSEEIRRSLVSYNGHLKHGHTWKLRRHIYTQFVLRRADDSNESEGTE